MSLGQVLALIRTGEVTSRAELARVTGLARSTAAQRVDALIAAGLVKEEKDAAASTGGRPPTRIEFHAGGGLILAVDLGASHGRLAVTDLNAQILLEESFDMAIASGPEVVLGTVNDRLMAMLDRLGRRADQVRAIGIGVPGPVEFAAGRVVSPPIMPGWDGVPLPEYFRDRFPVPVLVDNDVNTMAMGEYYVHYRDRIEDLLLVKVGTGIGCGIIGGGRIHRGAQGTAGDIGHVRIVDPEGGAESAGEGSADVAVRCHCGNTGCVEAVASGAAMARALDSAGIPASSSRDVVMHVRAGNAEAIRLVRHAGRLLGQVLASAVNFFNPAVIVIGGDIAQAHEHLFAGLREVVYQRSTALATLHLQIAASRLGDRAGVVGAAVIAMEHILAPAAVEAAVRSAADDVARK